MIRGLLRRLHKPIYEYRQKRLVELIAPHLHSGNRVLDVGCGFGHLGRALVTRIPGLTVEGIERVRRGGELIPITEYDGRGMPWNDSTFDAVILADVLHHDLDPDALLREAARVSKRLVIVKDHLREGFLAHQRISLLDWAANAGYNVPCTYRYNNRAEWRRTIGNAGTSLIEERTSIDIYPAVFNQIFGRGLHYFAIFAR